MQVNAFVECLECGCDFGRELRQLTALVASAIVTRCTDVEGAALNADVRSESLLDIRKHAGGSPKERVV